ncbi:MAG: helix-turn-helix domain-containing protein [Candidatus Dormibacteraeota bacterium]|nr:helix-turn-helix domain-containing protein [Candidatus Dormibacteraeota bacterium]
MITLPSEYLTVREAASELGVSSFTVRRWIAKGLLSPYVSRGVIGRRGQLLVSKAQVEAWLYQPVEGELDCP